MSIRTAIQGLALLMAAALMPSPLAAQGGPVVPRASIERPAAALELPALPLAEKLELSAQETDRATVAWMAVGGAAVLVGLAIGGDGGNLVAIAGGVIGLAALFRYLR